MKNFKKLIKEAHLGNPLNEATDFNDPALIKARAAQMKRDEMDKEEAEYKAKQAALDKKYGSSFMDKLEAEIDLKNELADLEDEREDVIRNMEEEAEPEGGPIADDYGSILNDMDAKIAAIKSDLDDLRMYESVNEGRSMARFSYADKGSPIKVGDTLYKDGKAGKVIQKLDWKDAFNVEFDDGTMIQVPFTSVEGDKIIREDKYLKKYLAEGKLYEGEDNSYYIIQSWRSGSPMYIHKILDGGKLQWVRDSRIEDAYQFPSLEAAKSELSKHDPKKTIFWHIYKRPFDGIGLGPDLKNK